MRIASDGARDEVETHDRRSNGRATWPTARPARLAAPIGAAAAALDAVMDAVRPADWRR